MHYECDLIIREPKQGNGCKKYNIFIACRKKADAAEFELW